MLRYPQGRVRQRQRGSSNYPQMTSSVGPLLNQTSRPYAILHVSAAGENFLLSSSSSTFILGLVPHCAITTHPTPPGGRYAGLLLLLMLFFATTAIQVPSTFQQIQAPQFYRTELSTSGVHPPWLSCGERGAKRKQA